MSSAIEVAENQVVPTSRYCEPLFENTSICYFSHIEYYHNGDAICLATNKPIIKFVWENEYYLRRQDLEEFDEYSVMFGHSSDRNIDMCNILNIDHMIRYIVKYDTHYEVNAFGSSKPLNQMIDFYLNNIRLLKLFVHYFRHSAESSIETSKKTPFILPEFDNGFMATNIQRPCTQALKSELEIDQLLVQYKLSPRELECMTLLSAGKTTKEIAKQISLSPHTVQFYINNLKQKVNCKKVAEIISLYYQSKI
tara:strand:- start:16895 stop:17650 length:756 start_codon:yes stop_codon:yes gene_type:complete